MAYRSIDAENNCHTWRYPGGRHALETNQEAPETVSYMTDADQVGKLSVTVHRRYIGLVTGHGTLWIDIHEADQLAHLILTRSNAASWELA